MNELLSHWLTRLVVVSVATYAAYRFGPKLVSGDAAKGVVKTISLAVGGMAGTALIVSNAPVVGPALGSVLQGQLPMPAPTAQPTT